MIAVVTTLLFIDLFRVSKCQFNIVFLNIFHSSLRQFNQIHTARNNPQFNYIFSVRKYRNPTRQRHGFKCKAHSQRPSYEFPVDRNCTCPCFCHASRIDPSIPKRLGRNQEGHHFPAPCRRQLHVKKLKCRGISHISQALVISASPERILI